MSIEVKWSDHLEALSDGLFEAWEKDVRQAGSLFGKVCVVVHDLATRDWLKNRYLLDFPQKRVLMNLDFVLLQEFINDWLEAEVQGVDPRERKPAGHSYSQEILAWRIYGILSGTKDSVFAPLYSYIGEDAATAPARRYALSAQLARLYDDYLNSRFAVLRSWETGEGTAHGGFPEWQKELYCRLYAQDSHSYASDYTQALSPATDASLAFQHGFPRYLSVHVFDVPFMSEPVMSVLEKISEALPMTAWSFNPCGDWLGDSPTKKEEIRLLCRQVRKELKDACLPTQMDANLVFASPEERLLGALATGARATLGSQIDWGADTENVLGTPNDAFDKLKELPTAIHISYSPRRELETVKDALHHFFKTHPDAHPHDALVLCADWKNYAPVIETVFGGNSYSPNSIPVAIAGGIPGDSPLIHSFKDLLDFRSNRFEVSAVFNLLSIPSIARKFNLDAESVSVLRNLVQEANIHWGLDDGHVRDTLQLADSSEHFPFTWQRGLDRLSMDMLCGSLPDGQEILQVGDLCRLRPTGSVESSRADALKSLWDLIHTLSAFRHAWTATKERKPEEWESLLLQLIDDLYQLEDQDISEMQTIRRAITTTAEAIQRAQALAGAPCDVDGEVVAEAVVEQVGSLMPCTRSRGDAVLFAPLKAASATPHRFVWLCGLNDGAFPGIQRRPSFDAIGKHPSLFDVDSRERDAYALLKAILSARDVLSLSYVGRNITDNQEMPPSVLLNDVIDYLTEKGIPFKTCQHPLQSFSPSYFRKDSTLPPSYSKSNWRIAQTLTQVQNQDGALSDNTQPKASNISAFDFNPDGTTILELEELAEFYARPNTFLFKKRLNLRTEWFKQLDDNAPLGIRVTNEMRTRLILDPKQPDGAELQTIAESMVETGNAPTQKEGAEALAEFCGPDYDGARNYPLKYAKNKGGAYSCPGTTVYDGVRAYRSLPVAEPRMVCCEVDGHQVRLDFAHKSVPLQTQGMGNVEHVFYMDACNGEVYDSTLVHAWFHHLAGHASGLSFMSVCCAQPKGKGKPARTFMPLPQSDALSQLTTLVATAFHPLAPGYPDYEKANNKEDKSYDGLREKLPIVSTSAR